MKLYYKLRNGMRIISLILRGYRPSIQYGWYVAFKEYKHKDNIYDEV